jgi:uncharacterized protein YraI
MSLLPRVAVAAALFALSTAAAYATPATTRGSTTVFDGPSTQFDVVTVLPPDTDIEIIGCSRGWCEVDLADQEGFVRQRALDFYEDEPAVIIFPPVVYRYGWNYWRYYYRGDWERWRGRYGRPQRPYVAPQVPPRGPLPNQPNMAPPIPRPGQPIIPPQIQRPTQPNFEPPASRQGPPFGGPGLPQRDDRPSAPRRPQDLGPPSPPGGMPPPPGGPPPPPG